ncbi:MATE family efflux transporter [Shewanella sp. Isolate11]|uniref:MATE family efflux transporter n=1 Tax=Shewanella sp. Isolate11 TaxID=2908530 RepID=UPI001EFD1DCD|nr:MATE family efflux transporter [Shewanella sp. Isolate11]MCG9698342.1 MATE family efflux transporter [Shewanella sp. Isolate11]
MESDLPLSQQNLSVTLFKATWPMVFGVLAIMSFQLVDSAFIGQLGVIPLALQGFTMPLQMVLIGVQVGFGIAATVLIAKLLGGNQTEEAKQMAGLTISLGVIVIGLVCLLLYLFRFPLLSALGATQDVYPLVSSYWAWWGLSAWLGALQYFLYSVCRANGNTMLPGIMMVVTSVLNIALDPLFIFVLGWGINGAAIATCLSFVCGIVILAYRLRGFRWLSFQHYALQINSAIKQISHIFFPAVMSQLMPSLSAILATKLLASFGAAAVAAWGLGSRVEFFAIVVVLALTMSLPPMISHALGAGQLERITKLVRIALLFVLSWQLFIGGVSWIGADYLAQLMSSEQQVSQILRYYLLLVPFSLGALGCCMILVSVSNALGKSYMALLISLVRLFGLFLPCIWFGAQFGGIEGIFIGAFIGNLLAGAFAYFTYLKTMTGLAVRA